MRIEITDYSATAGDIHDDKFRAMLCHGTGNAPADGVLAYRQLHMHNAR